MKVCPSCQRSYPTSFAVCPQDGARLTEGLEWAEGTLIRGKYRIQAKIGEGGMGAVYKALHVHFNESCALKVMSPALANDASLVKRFGREAIIARKLRHKNAVKVDDFDETEDGRPFIVMEYVEGQSLKSLMTASGPLPVTRTCSIIKQAAAALDAAHELGLIHRDVKPDNIVLVVSHGEEVAKVLDFGIAKIRDAQNNSTAGMGLTATGMVIGTPPYMSPEQARGADNDGIDGRSDIYSLGVVMYQMLTGTLPLKGDTPLDMLFAQIRTPPTPIHEARPGLRISEPIGAVVMKCLEKDPARRPQSGRELIEELDLCERAQLFAPRSSSTQDFSESTTVADSPVPFPRTAQPISATTLGADAVSSEGIEIETRRSGRTPLPIRVPTAPVPVTPPVVTPASANTEGEHSGEGAASSLRSMAIAIVAVLVLAAGVAGWYFFGRSSGHRDVPFENRASGAAGAQAAPAGAAGSDTQPPHTQSGSPDGPTRSPMAKVAAPQATPPTPALTAEEKAARSKRVSATTSLGDLYFDNGEFDNAIKEYQLGLDADPSSKFLLERLDRARKAKEAGQSAKP